MTIRSSVPVFAADPDALSTVAQASRVSVDSYPSGADAWTATVRVNQNLGAAVTISLSVYAVCTV